MTDTSVPALKTIVVTSFAVVAVVAAFIGVDLAFAVSLAVIGWAFEVPYVTEIGLLWLIMAFWVLPKNWGFVRRGYSCKGSVVIKASIEDIWAELRPSHRGSDYRATIDRMSSDPQIEGRYYLHFDPRLTDETSRPVPIDIVKEEPLRYLMIDYPDADALPGGAADLCCSEIFLEPDADGVHVTFQDSLRRLSATSIVSIVCFNPCEDAALRLKAWMEGTQDPSQLGRLMDGMSVDGTPDASLRSGVIVAGVTAFIMLSAIGAGIAAYLAWTIPML